MKKLLPIVLGVLVVLGGAFAASQFGLIAIPGIPGKAGFERSVSTPNDIGPMVKLDPLIINLKEESGRSYLKTTIVLELSNKRQLEEVDKTLPALSDFVILTLSDRRLEEVKQPEFKERMKQELLSGMNQYFPSKAIKRIYFDEFIYE